MPLLIEPIAPTEPQGTLELLFSAAEDWIVGSRDGALHPRHAVQWHERVATNAAADEFRMTESGWSEPDDED